MKLVTVYGSLLEGLGNWRWFLNNESSEKLGEHVIEDDLIMVSFGGFPGLIKTDNIKNKIFVETYKVTEDTYRGIERLEGFVAQDHPSNFYNKMKVETPFGESEVYVLNRKTVKSEHEVNHLVPSDEEGIINWRKYKTK